MSTTPTADSRNQYTRQIDGAFEAASKLAGSNLPPTDFYQQFLNSALSAIDAPAGAVWMRTPQGFLQIACQLNLDKIGLDAKRGGRQCHNEVLRMIFQAQPPQPHMLEPNGRLGASPSPTPNSGVPAANLTDYFALFAPIISPEKQPLGVLEIFQAPTHDPRLYPTFLNFTQQMAGYASQYHQFSTTRSSSGMEKSYSQVEAFARLVHSSLDPTLVGYLVANEGRKAIECDRLCVGIRHGRNKITIEAVSGADVVEKASTHIRRMRRLMEAVNNWGETLSYKGVKDEGLPPAVSHSLDAYLAESTPKFLVVQPVRDERENATAKAKTKKARSVLLLESFNPPEQTEPLVQRLEVIGKHAAPALYNSAEMNKVPFKFLWWPVLKLQEGFGGKARFFTIAGVTLVAALVAAMIFVPKALRMEAKGQLLPVEIGQVYAPLEGIVREIKVKPGEQVATRTPVVYLQSPELETRIEKILGELNVARANQLGAQAMLREGRASKSEETELLTKVKLAELTQANLQQSLDSIYNAYNVDKSRKGGYFMAIVEDKNAQKRESGSVRWSVLDDDKRDKLLGRTVKPNEPLVRVGNLDGTWRLELKIPQRNMGQVLKAFATPGMHKIVVVDPNDRSKDRPYLDVDVLLASEGDRGYLGRLYRDGLAGEAVPNRDDHSENEPIVTANVMLNLADFPPELRINETKFLTGLEVRTRIRCGEHSLGYAWFHGVWEWFYEKVIFFF